jgi:hypothetical protein
LDLTFIQRAVQLKSNSYLRLVQSNNANILVTSNAIELAVVVASRSDFFIIGVTNNSPTTRNYTLCGQWPGAAPGGQTLFILCPSGMLPGRYVMILGFVPLLPVCELQVYAAGKLQ